MLNSSLLCIAATIANGGWRVDGGGCVGKEQADPPPPKPPPSSNARASSKTARLLPFRGGILWELLRFGGNLQTNSCTRSIWGGQRQPNPRPAGGC